MLSGIFCRAAVVTYQTYQIITGYRPPSPPGPLTYAAVVIYEIITGGRPPSPPPMAQLVWPPPPPDSFRRVDTGGSPPPSPDNSRRGGTGGWPLPPSDNSRRGGTGGRPLPPSDNSRRGGTGGRPPGDSRKSSPPSDNSQKPPSDFSKRIKSVLSKDDKTSDKSTVVQRSTTPDNNLRKRNVDQTSSKQNSLADSRNAAKGASKTISELPSSSGNQYSPDKKFDEINYSRNMLDKLTNDAKNINENIKNEKCLSHNICEEDSDSAESNLIPKDEVKLINQSNEETVSHSKKLPRRKKKSKQARLKSAKNNTDNFFGNSDHHKNKLSSDSHSDDFISFAATKITKANPTQEKYANKDSTSPDSKSQSSNLYPKIDFHPLSDLGSDTDKSSLCSDEDTYKRQLHESLKNDVYGIKEDHVDSAAICSPERIEEEKPTDAKTCRGCEEKQVNTRTSPCNHSYLCADCAVIVFKIYKKCAICHAHVKEFLQFAL